MHKFSITRNFKLLSIVLIILVLLSSIWFTSKIYDTYNSQSIKVVQKLTDNAKRITDILINDFEYTKYQMEYIARKIKENPEDLNKIHELLKSFRSNSNINIVLSWNMFSWVDKNLMLIVDGNEGILKDPVYMSNRDYIPKTVSEPGNIFLGDPVFGAVSKQWLIPAGIGVTDKNNNYLGSLIFGFDIASLSYKINQVVRDYEINYFIVNKSGEIITSLHSERKDLPKYLKDRLEDKSLLNTGVLTKQSLFDKKSSFSYYENLNSYGYSVITTFNNQFFYLDFFNNWVSHIIEFLLVGFVNLVVLYILYRQIILPIGKLSNIAEKVSGGNMEIEIPDSRIKEIHILSEQLKKVVYYTKALARAHSSLEEKVKERTQELEKALSIKTEFSNNISHEVRTPVQGITALSEGLVACWDKFDEAKRLDLAKKLQGSANRLFSLVRTILDLSKINTGKLSMSKKSVDLISLIEDMIDECNTLYLEHKNININFKSSIEKAMIYADPERITQVLRNLFTNSIRYGGEGTIDTKISYDTSKNEYIFSIEDEGVGIT